jgi:methylated-DNA-protein-cysteine methyltransferase related protein
MYAQYIQSVPVGYVSSYGRIARMADQPRAARQVGWWLAGKHEDLPWWRIVNQAGRLSIVHPVASPAMQAQLLRDEGVLIEERPDGFWVVEPRWWPEEGVSQSLPVR